MPDNTAYAGMATPFDLLHGDFNQVRFVAQQLINRRATTTLVQVVAVTNTGQNAAVGFVDVKPMVHQVDGKGQPMPHGTIHRLPYLRMQGGPAAIIMDPHVGDIGMASFCSHDISKVKNTKQPALPGSGRRFSMSDGLYHGGMLNGAPQHVVRFDDQGVHVETPLKVQITATQGIDLHTDGNLTIEAANFALGADGSALAQGHLAASGEVYAQFGAPGQVTLSQHHHPAINAPPTPGT
jgi:Phage protein Gp138 N-terminal domain